MKGNITITVEVKTEVNLPITEKWEYSADNTPETPNDWLELFEKILYVQGFAPYKLDIAESENS